MNHLEKIIFILMILLLMLGSFSAGVLYERKTHRSRIEHRSIQSMNWYERKINSYIPYQYAPHKTANFNLIQKFRG